MTNWVDEHARRHYQPTKRKVYFAFRFEDIMRVNNVRQSGKIGSEETKNARDFYDRSIWERCSKSEPESLKRLMREGVQHSSAVCVLIGSNTWQSRWVKYEIARAVIDNKGLLGVHINGLTSVRSLLGDAQGYNPLQILGIYKAQNNSCYLAERRWNPTPSNPSQYTWFKYDDYTAAVPIPRYLTVTSAHPVALAAGTLVYDYISDLGVQNLGSWINFAATQVGR